MTHKRQNRARVHGRPTRRSLRNIWKLCEQTRAKAGMNGKISRK